MNHNWVILSHTGGFRERHFTHEPYFECNSDSLAIGILTFYFLTIDAIKRELLFASYLEQYLYTIKGNTINGIQYRFENWLVPIFRTLLLIVKKEEVKQLFVLHKSSGEVIEEGLTAYRAWEKGKEITKQNKSTIATISCFWGKELSIRTCEVCGCRQPVFILMKTVAICFECYIGNSKEDTFRETIKEMYDADGNKIKGYTKYITPQRRIVFFDRDFNRMIYMTGITEIPIPTEYLHKL